MKNIKIILIVLTVALVFLNIGIYLGRAQHDGDVSVIVEKKADEFGKIDINHAPVSTLCLLPGVSTTIGQRIVDYREQHGPYESIYDLLNVSGISEGTLAQFKDYIYIKK